MIAAVALVAAGAVGGAVVPGAMVREADQRARACLDARPPGECRRALEATLALPLATPWQRARAERVRDAHRFRFAAEELAQATSTAPDEAQRTAAADALVTAAHAARARGLPADALGVMERAGADADIARLHTVFATDASPASRAAVLRAAWRGGDRDAVLRAAAAGAAGDDAPALRHDLARGAWLCLLGARDAGLAALEAAYTRRAALGAEGARVALARRACGAADDDALREDPAAAVLAASDPAAGADARAAPARLLRGAMRAGPGADRLPLVAQWAGREALATEALLALVAPRAEPAGVALLRPLAVDARHTPCAVLALSATDARAALPALAAPETYDAAAARLAIAAARAPEAVGAASEGLVADPGARGDPRRYLRYGAAVMWLEAAAAWAQQGEFERAGAAATRADGVGASELATLTVPLHLLAGDTAAAVGRLERFDAAAIEQTAAIDRVISALQHALALAGARRFDDAYGYGLRANEAALRAVGAAEGPAATLAQRLALETSWVRAALALKTGRATEDLAALLPAGAAGGGDGLASLAYWLELLRRPEGARRGARRAAPALAAAPVAVLPAVFFVVGEAARGAGDVEVWLDRVASRELPGVNGRAYLFARGEAARWRGDAGAAARWEAQAARWMGAARGASGAVLASVAGL